MEETPKASSYFIDFEAAESDGRALSLLIATRKCYADRQADTEESVLSSDPQEHLDRIVEHCADTPDYLLPDTPLKDALFRVILAAGNRMMTADEISADLSARWATSTYPRDLSPRVIARVLGHSQSYCVAEYREPEPEPEPEELAPLEAVEEAVGDEGETAAAEGAGSDQGQKPDES